MESSWESPSGPIPFNAGEKFLTIVTVVGFGYFMCQLLKAKSAQTYEPNLVPAPEPIPQKPIFGTVEIFREEMRRLDFPWER